MVISGVYTVSVRDSQTKEEVPADVEFVTSAGLTIVEDSMDNSINKSNEVDAVELGVSQDSPSKGSEEEKDEQVSIDKEKNDEELK